MDMKRSLILATSLAACALLATRLIIAETDSTHVWTGVWQGKALPGVTITLADDSGALAGTIVFNVADRENGKIIAIEPRTLVNPHVSGDGLAFQVKRILKPHLKGDASANAFDPADIADMTLKPDGHGKVMLICAQCGATSPTEMVKLGH
jgi:hypothetical protein